MESINVTEARANLYRLIEKTVDTNKPIQINSKGGDVVMMSVADYEALQETIYLAGIPGMAQSLIEGKNTPIQDCIDEADFIWPKEDNSGDV